MKLGSETYHNLKGIIKKKYGTALIFTQQGGSFCASFLPFMGKPREELSP